MRHLILGVLILGVSSNAWAEDPATTESVKPAERVSVLFLQLKAIGNVDSTKTKLLENIIVAELHKYRGFDVISREDVENLLDADGVKQAFDCDATSCLVNVAGALGTDLLVSSSLGYIDEETAVLSMQVVNTVSSSVRSRVAATIEGSGRELIPQVQRAVMELMSGDDPSYKFTASLDPRSPMSQATAQASVEDGGLLTKWWLWTGVAVVAAGVGAYLYTSGDSSKKDVAPTDTVPIVGSVEVGNTGGGK